MQKGNGLRCIGIGGVITVQFLGRGSAADHKPSRGGLCAGRTFHGGWRVSFCDCTACDGE